MNLYIGVGSNIEAEKNISSALKMMRSRNFKISGISTHYRTRALGNSDSPPYINGVWRIELSDEAAAEYDDLDRILKDIEGECGRIRGDDKWADRTIDLDILLLKDYSSKDIGERDFIYIPLLELDPGLSIPGLTGFRRGTEQMMIPLKDFTETLRRLIDE